MMTIGYIRKNNLELNPHLTEKFKFIESTCTRRISSKSDRLYSKKFMPLDYEECMANTKIMTENPSVILVGEPFILNEELRENVIRWIEWANEADPSEYDPFAKKDGDSN